MQPNNLSNYAFIFDLDGTLVNSFSQILKCLKKTSAELSMLPIDSELTWSLFGQPLIEIVSANGVPSNQISKYVDTFRGNLRSEIKNRNELFDGVIDLISKIHKLDLKLGIATSKPTDLAKLVCQNSDLSLYPFAIQGSEDIPPKPNPTVIKKVLAKLGVSSGIMIGDRTEDIKAGKAAGLNTCAILQSAHQRKDFELIMPDFIFDSIEDLNCNLQDILELVD